MSSKQQRKLNYDYQSRSAAAKRGWETRRKRQATKLLIPAVNNGQSLEPEILQIQPIHDNDGALLAEMSEVETPAAFIQKPYPDALLSQIYHSGLEYAWVNASGEQCHPFAYCKDFLQDALWALLNQKEANIYDFRYNGDVMPKIDLETTRIALRFSGRADFAALCRNTLRFVNAIESELNFTPSVLGFGGTAKKGEIWVFTGDAYWMHAPPLVSLYTLLLRAGLNYGQKSWREHLQSKSFLGENDREYVNSANLVFEKLPGINVRDVFAEQQSDNYPVDCDVSTMHNKSGICCWAKSDVNPILTKAWRIKHI